MIKYSQKSEFTGGLDEKKIDSTSLYTILFYYESEAAKKSVFLKVARPLGPYPPPLELRGH